MRAAAVRLDTLRVQELPLGLPAAGPIIARFGYSASTRIYVGIGLAATIDIGFR